MHTWVFLWKELLREQLFILKDSFKCQHAFVWINIILLYLTDFLWKTSLDWKPFLYLINKESFLKN